MDVRPSARFLADLPSEVKALVTVIYCTQLYTVANDDPSDARGQGNWIRFRVSTGIRDAYGATVSATVGSTRTYRDVQPSASYLASSDPRVHFGLAKASTARDVRVRWPGCLEEMFGDFDAGVTHELIAGQGTVSR